MTTAFLLQLAKELRVGKDAAGRRVIERVLLSVMARFEAGKYSGQLDAEFDMRELVQQTCALAVK